MAKIKYKKIAISIQDIIGYTVPKARTASDSSNCTNGISADSLAGISV